MRRLRRARALLGAGLAAVAVLAVLGLARLVTPDSDPAAPATTAQPPSAVVAATRTLLTGVEPGYVVTGPGEWVRTTRGAYGRLAGFDGEDPNQEVYVVQLRGRFTCAACPRPPGAKAQTGSALISALPVRGSGETTFYIGHPIDLS